MKLLSALLLFVFITFITVPSIITMIDENCGICIIDDTMEEKESTKDLKVEFNFIETICLNKTILKNVPTIIISKCKFKHEIISSTIFIPPPETV